MKDRMLKQLVTSIKDLAHLDIYFEDTEAFYNTFEAMTTEAGRLMITKKLIENVGKMRNDFIKTADALDKLFSETRFEIKELYTNQADILSTLANQRLITNTLTNQLLKITEVIESAQPFHSSYILEASLTHPLVLLLWHYILYIELCIPCLSLIF